MTIRRKSGVSRNWPLFFPVLTVVAAVTAAIACGQQVGSPELAVALAKTGGQQSYRETTEVLRDGMREVTEVEVADLDNFHMKATKGEEWREIIRLSEKVYYQDSANPEWQLLSQGEFDYVTVSLETILQPFNWTVNVKSLEGEEIDGVPCEHYRGEIDWDAYVEDVARERGITGPDLEEMREWETAVEFWIDAGNLIRQMTTEARIPGTDPASGEKQWANITSTTRLSDFDAAIEVVAPIPE